MDSRLTEVLSGVELTECEKRYLEWLSRMDGETVEVFAELFEKIKKPVSGEWLDDGFFVCTVCGESSEYASNYCPECGADMREGK